MAPVLYVIHAFFDGLAFMIAHILHITIGQTFSGGFIDFILFGVLQGEAKTHWMYVPLVGVPWFCLYYFTFRFLINRFGFMTPGREKEAAVENTIPQSERAAAVIAGLGGRDEFGRGGLLRHAIARHGKRRRESRSGSIEGYGRARRDPARQRRAGHLWPTRHDY